MVENRGKEMGSSVVWISSIEVLNKVSLFGRLSAMTTWNIIALTQISVLSRAFSDFWKQIFHTFTINSRQGLYQIDELLSGFA